MHLAGEPELALAKALLALHWLLCAYTHLRYPREALQVIERVTGLASPLIPRLLGVYMALLGLGVAQPVPQLTRAALIASAPMLVAMIVSHAVLAAGSRYRALEQANLAKTMAVAAATILLYASP